MNGSFVRLRSIWGGGLCAAFLVFGCSEVGDPPSPSLGGEDSDRVLAQVGEREIKVRNLLHKIDVQLPVMQDAVGSEDVKNKSRVVRQMMDQYCWVGLAEKEGWDQDPEFLAVLELSRKFILANHASEKAVYSQAHPSEEEMRTYYDENIDQFQTVPRAKADYVLCRDLDHARQVYQKLQAGADFTATVRAESADERTRDSGGRLGTLSPASDLKGFPGEYSLNKAILELPEGGVSQPVESSKGWAIFRAYDRVEPGVATFEAARSTIEEDLFNKRSNELFTEVLAAMREELNATMLDDAFVGYSCTLMTDEEIRLFARNERDATRKLLYYRGLLDTYPDSPLASHAQFMLGFVNIDRLRDYDAARKELQIMLEKFPNDELAPSAQWMLDNMDRGLEGKPDFEQLRQRLNRKRAKS